LELRGFNLGVVSIESASVGQLWFGGNFERGRVRAIWENERRGDK
jgi:hypothetical protein